MPEYKWTLKNKKFCTGCPLHAVIGTVVKVHECAVPYYVSVQLHGSAEKKRPIACVRELGD